MSDLSFSEHLLNWYDVHGRELPWRTRGPHPDPYVVWISEIMLQQTTVKTVIPYFERFMARFPDIRSLADADIDDVLLFWQGLGYYTRARKLHECARFLVSERGGVFPRERAALLKLPGIGPYTAASISALAFDRPETIVDGNVIRLMCRYYALEENADVIRDEIFKKADALTPAERAADYTSAILDVGATVCTPRDPDCGRCPVSSGCLAFRKGIQERLPIIKKPEKKEMRGPLFLIRNTDGAFLIQKRTQSGLLSGLTEFPWVAEETDPKTSNSQAAGLFASLGSFQNVCRIDTGRSVRHIFTHIRLVLDIYVFDGVSEENAADIARIFPEAFFVRPTEFENYAFSTLMKKVIRLIENGEFAGRSSKDAGKSGVVGHQTDLGDFSE